VLREWVQVSRPFFFHFFLPLFCSFTKIFFAFFSSLFSSLLLGKSFEEEEEFLHSLVGLYDGGSSIRCAHTREHHAVREREREKKEKKREKERRRRETRRTERERERERRIAFF
jgi:hypothetical protein